MVFDTGSNPLLNNATKGRTSNKYFKSIFKFRLINLINFDNAVDIYLYPSYINVMNYNIKSNLGDLDG